VTLSLKHIQVRDFILKYQAEHEESPSLKEIAAACELTNLMAAWRYRNRLRKAGELKFVGYEAPKAKAATKV
jgi:hypothetical protein